MVKICLAPLLLLLLSGCNNGFQLSNDGHEENIEKYKVYLFEFGIHYIEINGVNYPIRYAGKIAQRALEFENQWNTNKCSMLIVDAEVSFVLRRLGTEGDMWAEVARIDRPSIAGWIPSNTFRRPQLEKYCDAWKPNLAALPTGYYSQKTLFMVH